MSKLIYAEDAIDLLELMFASDKEGMVSAIQCINDCPEVTNYITLSEFHTLMHDLCSNKWIKLERDTTTNISKAVIRFIESKEGSNEVSDTSL